MTMTATPSGSAASSAVNSLDRLKSSTDAASACSALRSLKNLLIGNRHHKEAVLRLGGVPVIVATALTHHDSALWTEAAAALASIAHLHAAASCEQLKQCQGGIELLVQMLDASNPKASQSAASVLRVMCTVRTSALCCFA